VWGSREATQNKKATQKVNNQEKSVQGKQETPEKCVGKPFRGYKLKLPRDRGGTENPLKKLRATGKAVQWKKGNQNRGRKVATVPILLRGRQKAGGVLGGGKELGEGRPRGCREKQNPT